VLRWSIAGGVFAMVCVLAMFAPVSVSEDEPAPRWISIIPALLAIVAAIASGRIIPSLVAGIVAGGVLITAEQSIPLSPITGPWEALLLARDALTDLGNLRVLIFVALILTTITIIGASGGLVGLVRSLERFARGRRSTQLTTALMGLVLFIDDYANAMIVGSTMRSPSDAHRISREKLAFIVDATSAPIAGLAFVSTWVGYEIGLFDDLSQTLVLGREGIELLFQALPYRFYCIFLLAFVFVQIAMRREFGPMRRAEQAAIDGESTSPELSNGDPTENGVAASSGAAILPIGTLLAVVIGGVWINGGGLTLLRADMFSPFRVSAWQSIIADAGSFSMWLVVGGVGGLAMALICARTFGRLNTRALGTATGNGLRRSLFPCSVLVCAWSLKGACKGLGTDDFLVALLADQVAPQYFAAIVFLLAGATAFATGTSYGTMGILLPTATPVAYALEGGELGIVTIATLAAVLDGAIFGDHCSPISDTTIMSSAGSGCDHIKHVKTQMPYALSVGVIALVCGYGITGMGISPLIAYGIGLTAVVGVLVLLGRRLHPVPERIV
jgi:Na+/H+ antiporter NhaC